MPTQLLRPRGASGSTGSSTAEPSAPDRTWSPPPTSCATTATRPPTGLTTATSSPKAFRMVVVGERVRFDVDDAGHARFVIRLDLPEDEEFYR